MGADMLDEARTVQQLGESEALESPFVTAPPTPRVSDAPSDGEARWAEEDEGEGAADSEVWTGTGDQIEFRDRVLAAHIARSKARSGSPKRDLRSDELRKVSGTDVSTLPDTATAAGRLLAAANAELARAQSAGDADALRTIRLGATSGYRGSAHQRALWLRYFADKGGYYDRSRAAREMLPEGPHSDQALAYMLKPKNNGGFGLGGRIAAPGYSNHQAGIAIDLAQERRKGYRVANKSDDASRRIWRNTWFHRWLKDNAAKTFGFKPISTEEWHWEYRPASTGRGSVREAYEEIGEEEMPAEEAELEAESVLEVATEDEEEAAPTDTSGRFTFTSSILPMKVAVFVPPSARRASKVEVLVFAHGLDRCPVHTPLPMAFVTDKAFALGDVVEASARPIILVVPFLDWEHFRQRKLVFGQNWHAFAKPENLNGVIAEVLERVAASTGTGTAPTLLRLILSGHSRAFGILDALAKARANPEMSNGALGRLSHVWAFDTTYTSPVADWMAWLGSRDDLKATVVYRHGTSRSGPLSTGVHGRQFLAHAKQSNGRLSVIPVPSGSVGHCAVPRKYLPLFLESLPAVSPTSSDEEEYLEVEGEFDTELTEGDVSTEFDVLGEEAMEEWDTETEELEDEAEEFESTEDEEPSLEAFGAFDESAMGTEEEETEEESEAFEEVWNEQAADTQAEESEAEVLEASGLTPAELKAVQITSTFETGHRGGFYGLSGNFDGQGLSFGLVNWTIGTGSLQPLLRDFAAEEPARWAKAFGRDAARFLAVITPKDKASQAAQLRFAIDEMNDWRIVSGKRKWSVKEPWVTYFKSLSEDSAFQRIQVRHVRQLLDRARYFCEYFGLKSERAFAFMFDAVSSHGQWWLTKRFANGVQKRRELLRTRLTALEATHGKGKVPEGDLLLAIADVLADTSASRWSDKVRVRKRWFVTGQHARANELKGLEPRPDVPYVASGNGSQPASRPTPAPAPTPSPTSRVTSSSGMSEARRAELIAAALSHATTAGKADDRMAIAAALKANGTDPAMWFADFVPDATFLGHEIQPSGGSVPGVHRKLLDVLKRAERTLLDNHPGSTAKQLGQDLGINRISGLRPPKKPTGRKSGVSFHCFGLAVDINHDTNPFVGNMAPKKDAAKYEEYMENRSPRIIERAMLLLRGERFKVDTDFATATGKSVSESDAGAAWDSHHRASDTLAQYLRLAKELDGPRLRTLVNNVQARGDTKTLAWWKTRIATDRLNLKNKQWDFVNHDHPEQTGYMDLPRALVVALVGAGLKWGGQYKRAKDIMHFDLREGWKRPN